MNLYPRLTKLLLAALGMSSLYACDDPETPDDLKVMYGTPHTFYQIKGSVTDETDKPVEGAVITLSTGYAEMDTYSDLPTAKTDKQGEYELKFTGLYPEKMLVKCEDVNAKYASMEQWVTFKYNKVSDKKDPWLSGTAEAKADFKLTKTE